MPATWCSSAASLIQSTGISEPLPVAETFTFTDDRGQGLHQVARLDTMVTVVDALNFRRQWQECQTLKEAGQSLGEEDERTVADLLADQVEFADVIILNKTDLVSPEEAAAVKALVHQLNGRAEILVRIRAR